MGRKKIAGKDWATGGARIGWIIKGHANNGVEILPDLAFGEWGGCYLLDTQFYILWAVIKRISLQKL